MRSRSRLLLPLLTASTTALSGALWIGAGPASAAVGAPPGGGHVVMPTLTAARAAEAEQFAALAPRAAAASTPLLTFHGGTSGTGVLTGKPKVYLVFWGSQWGAPTTTGGVTSFSTAADPSQEAVVLQRFFAGLGSNNESWSAIATQYCQGTNGAMAHVSTSALDGATSCSPKNWAHVSYPSGGVLAGVWADVSSAAPSAATQAQLANEAYAATQHFGNTTPASNQSAEYFVLSPTGTDPDSWKGSNGFCAWHDFIGDPTLLGSALDAPNAQNTSAGLVSFTNFPYLTDQGLSCGSYYVNSDGSRTAPVSGDTNPMTNGTDDGLTIVGGHEYAEALTDPVPVQGRWAPAGGWYTNNKQNSQKQAGAELADLCSWGAGGTGAADAVDLRLTTGTFAVQALWSNAGARCKSADSIVTMANLGPVTATTGSPIDLRPAALTTALRGSLVWGATGLPSEVSINSSTGEISGSISDMGTWSIWVTATDVHAVTASRLLTLNVTNPTSPARN